MNEFSKKQSLVNIEGGKLFFSFILVVFLLYIAVTKYDLLFHGTISLLTTIICSILYPGRLATYWRIELIEYWIASISYFAILFLSVFSLIYSTGLLKKNKIPGIVRIFLMEKMNNRLGRIGLYSLYFFVMLALLAPFAAPIDPYAQGDLVKTRLLKPLQRAKVTVVIPPTVSKPVGITSIENRLRKSNNYLLNRITHFTLYNSTERYIIPNDNVKISTVTLLFGTDSLGRDVFSRVIYGTRISVGIGFSATLIAIFVGSLVGLISGIFSGITDKILMRIVDVFLSIPSLFLIIAFVAFLGRSLTLMIIILAVTGWMGTARLVRGEVLKLREREFILSAKLLGVSTLGIIRNHLIPNVLPIILTAAVLQLGNVILAEAALSFLGLGTQPPIPSWGNIIGEAMAYLRSAWWIGIFPGIALSWLVVSVHFIIEESQETLSRFTQ